MLPSYLDTECPCDPDQSIAEGSTDGCHNCLGYDLGGGVGSGWEPPSVVKQRLLDMANAVESMTGKLPILYSYEYWLTHIPQITGSDSACGAFPLDIANTGTDCANLGGSVPPPWQRVYFWQYSWFGSVPGVPGSVDLDRFFGSTSDLGALAAPPCGTPVAQPCTSTTQCCSGLGCKYWSYSGNAPYTTFCCAAVGASCSVGTDCCGGSACDTATHTCVCVPAGQWCINADECCSGYTCDLGTDKCVPAPPDAGSDAPADSGVGHGEAGAADGAARDAGSSPLPGIDAGGDAGGTNGEAPADAAGCSVARHRHDSSWLGTFFALAALVARRRKG